MKSIVVSLAVLFPCFAWACDGTIRQSYIEKSVDNTFKSASITRDLGPAEKPLLVLKKTSRLTPNVAGEQSATLGQIDVNSFAPTRF